MPVIPTALSCVIGIPFQIILQVDLHYHLDELIIRGHADFHYPADFHSPVLHAGVFLETLDGFVKISHVHCPFFEVLRGADPHDNAYTDG